MAKDYSNYDIKDAMELFEKFEGIKNNIPFLERLGFFKDAFEILHNCESDEDISVEEAKQIANEGTDKANKSFLIFFS